ncbi:NAD(P)-binding protein, partial [candidate division KSB3 bacterium]|nr:NAD(P)-binding protein [candidate division KSB3 bacterium]
KLVDCARHNNIELFTYSSVEAVSGEPGNFKVQVRCKSRYVDEAKCTGCGECEKVCPVERLNEFDRNLSARKAIYRPFPQATPNVFTIEKRGLSPCTDACPAGCNAHGYVALIRNRKFKEALELIRETIPLPAICGRVCGFCEEECNRANVEEAIRIRALKRFAADYEMTLQEPIEPPAVPAADRKEKVAIIGSGPAGLTAAYDLAKQGYQPVIFEAMATTGGMLRVGIPGYRLPDDILDFEVDVIKKTGVEIRTNTPLGPDLTIDDLLNQGFKAIFLAVGTHTNRLLRIEGEELEGVLSGVAFLRDVNSGKMPKTPIKDKVVAVIGGGNTAVDAVRSALRLGAKEAFIVYRRTKEQMPLNPEEREAAEEEGIKIHYLLAPIKINGQDGKVTELVCNQMTLGEVDRSGRRRPVPIEGKTTSFPVDVIIPALGQGVDYTLFEAGVGDLALKWDLIDVDPVTLQTNIPGVFAGGDATTISGGYVVHAIAHGHEVAISIDRYIRGDDLASNRKASPRQVAAMPEGFISQKPPQPLPLLGVPERTTSFKEVEAALSEDEAVKEASRCLDCGVCCECLQCVAACEAKAVNHDLTDTVEELHVGSILFIPGCSLSDLSNRYQYGYAKFPSVVTSLQFERILSASGPFGGHIQRPADGKEPKRLAFIQCVGSRDEEHDYCSSVCCMYALKEAIIAKEHDPDIHCDIFYMDIRAHGKGFDAYYDRAKELGINFTRCRPVKVEELKDSKDLRIGYLDDDGVYKTKEFDMAVLSVGFQPPAETKTMAEKLGISTDAYGFAATNPFDPIASSREGIYVCGPFSEPKDIPETVMEASSASSQAMVYLADARGTEVSEPELPPEKDVRGEPPRIGVFVCHCGKNIGGYVDVPSVAEYAKTLPHVVYADENLYTCSSDTQEILKA